MKYILIFILPFLFLSCIENKKKSIQTSNLNVITKYCQKERIGYHLMPEFEIYKNDTLIKVINSDALDSYRATELEFGGEYFTYNFKNLKPGDYHIDCITIFGKTETVNFKLAKGKSKLIELCLDHFKHKNETHLPFIDRLKEKEYYSIKISSLGDFTGGRHNSEAIISKINDNYFVQFRNKKSKLNQAKIEYIRRFELELINMESAGCTTVDSYLLTYNNEKIEISDGSCAWDGFNVLIRQLFPSYLN